MPYHANYSLLRNESLKIFLFMLTLFAKLTNKRYLDMSFILPVLALFNPNFCVHNVK